MSGAAPTPALPRFAGEGVGAALVAALVATLPGPALADEAAYTEKRRGEYVSHLLEAIGSADPDAREALAHELYLGARRDCRAGYGPPPVECLLELGRRICGERPRETRPTCRRIADVVITNLSGEWELVDESTRVSLMNTSENFRAAMRRELRARYALLAAELTLRRAKGDAALGPAIGRFCAQHTRTRRLTWSRCVAALAWYIGTYEEPGEAR